MGCDITAVTCPPRAPIVRKAHRPGLPDRDRVANFGSDRSSVRAERQPCAASASPWE